MRERVRVLGERDLASALELIAERPVENVFVASRVQVSGLHPHALGCEIWGYEVDGELVSLCHVGANLVPVNATNRAVDAFARKLGPFRSSASITGPSDVTLDLFAALSRHWGSAWRHPREVRPRQPVMVIDADSAVAGDPRVRRITRAEEDAYFAAAVAMYTEEVGVSPLDGTDGYRRYVARLIDMGRAFGIVEGGTVLFKSDVGAAADGVCQVQGVWLHPDLRGQGLSVPSMASVVSLCRLRWPTVSLYVNDFNARAIACYARTGFRTVGEFATVLY